MTPEEKFNQSIRFVLQELQLLKLYLRKGELAVFKIEVRPIQKTDEPSASEKEKALFKIEELGAIKIRRRDGYENTYGKDFDYHIEILPLEFEELLNEYKKNNKRVLVPRCKH